MGGRYMDAKDTLRVHFLSVPNSVVLVPGLRPSIPAYSVTPSFFLQNTGAVFGRCGAPWVRPLPR
jgi:hypothetical protein